MRAANRGVIIERHSRCLSAGFRHCRDYGCLWNTDGDGVDYDQAYFDRYVGMRGTPIARAINRARVEMVMRRRCRTVLDYGVGSGEFIETWRRVFGDAVGYDVNPAGVAWLKERGIYADPADRPCRVDGWTMWDVLEHLPRPWQVLDRVESGQYLFLTLPIWRRTDSVEAVAGSKHYKPGEHLYYFTAPGLITFLGDCGFRLLECNDEETRAGREDVLSFAFVRE